MNDVVTLISTLGFPIVACIGIAWYFVKVQERNDATIKELSKALNENTIAITKLNDKLENK
jgi:hypothetical protein